MSDEIFRSLIRRYKSDPTDTLLAHQIADNISRIEAAPAIHDPALPSYKTFDEDESALANLLPGLTYLELLTILSGLSPRQLEMPVRIFLSGLADADGVRRDAEGIELPLITPRDQNEFEATGAAIDERASRRRPAIGQLYIGVSFCTICGTPLSSIDISNLINEFGAPHQTGICPDCIISNDQID